MNNNFTARDRHTSCAPHPPTEPDELPQLVRDEANAELHRGVVRSAAVQVLAYVVELCLDTVARLTLDQGIEVVMATMITIGLVIVSYHLGRYVQWARDAKRVGVYQHGQVTSHE